MQSGMSYPQEPREDEPQGARKVIGIVLIGLGAIIALAVLQAVYQLLTDGTQFPLIQQLSAEAATIGMPDGEVTLPEHVLVLGAYGVIIVLLTIASGIARAFLQIGAQLLQVDVRTFIRQMRDEITRIGSGAPPSVPGARS